MIGSQTCSEQLQAIVETVTNLVSLPPKLLPHGQNSSFITSNLSHCWSFPILNHLTFIRIYHPSMLSFLHHFHLWYALLTKVHTNDMSARKRLACNKDVKLSKVVKGKVSHLSIKCQFLNGIVWSGVPWQRNSAITFFGCTSSTHPIDDLETTLICWSLPPTLYHRHRFQMRWWRLHSINSALVRPTTCPLFLSWYHHQQ